MRKGGYSMFYELLKKRRSIRRFLDKEVEQEKRDIILKSGLLAPSSRSRRPWEFIAITDKEVLKKLSGCREHGSQFLAGEPLALVVAADSEKCDVWIEDASIASIMMQLSAESLGLGSCWIQVRERFLSPDKKTEDYIKEALEVPDQYSIESIIAIGYSAEDKKPYDDQDLPYHKIHIGKY